MEFYSPVTAVVWGMCNKNIFAIYSTECIAGDVPPHPECQKS